jgi:hypothetical protein
LLRYLFSDEQIANTHLPLDENGASRGCTRRRLQPMIAFESHTGQHLTASHTLASHSIAHSRTVTCAPSHSTSHARECSDGFVTFTTDAVAQRIIRTHNSMPFGRGKTHPLRWAGSNLLHPAFGGLAQPGAGGLSTLLGGSMSSSMQPLGGLSAGATPPFQPIGWPPHEPLLGDCTLEFGGFDGAHDDVPLHSRSNPYPTQRRCSAHIMCTPLANARAPLQAVSAAQSSRAPSHGAVRGLAGDGRTDDFQRGSLCTINKHQRRATRSLCARARATHAGAGGCCTLTRHPHPHPPAYPRADDRDLVWPRRLAVYPSAHCLGALCACEALP